MASAKTYIVDTNVFLRFLTNDIPKQASKVEKRFSDAEKGKIKLRVLPITVVEILFHLERWYKLSKKDATEKLEDILLLDWMSVDNKEVVFDALRIYLEKNFDFVDVLTFSYAKNLNQKILSFDKDFKKLDPKLFEIL